MVPRRFGPVESTVKANSMWLLDNQGMSRGKYCRKPWKVPLQETEPLSGFHPGNEYFQAVGPPLRDQKDADGIAGGAFVRWSQGCIRDADFSMLGLESVRN